MFAEYFMNTWIAGTVVALCAGVVGVFVVMRGAAFLAHAIPHGSFAGAAVATYVGASSVTGMAVAAFASAAILALLGRRRRHRDTVIALLLVLLLAMGSFVLSLSGDYTNQVYALLFGQVLAVSTPNLITMAAFATLAIIAVLLMRRPLLLTSVMPNLASAQGVRHLWVEFAFTLVIAAITTASVPVVGAMLLFSLLVAPAAAACAVCSRPGHAVCLSCLLAVLCVWTSVALSISTDLPVGFFVAMTSTGIYVIAKILPEFSRSRHHQSTAVLHR